MSEVTPAQSVPQLLDDLAYEGFPSDPEAALERIRDADSPNRAVVEMVLVAFATIEEYQVKTQERVEQARRYRHERDEARQAAAAYEQLLATHGIEVPDLPELPERVTHLSDTQALPGPVVAPVGGRSELVETILVGTREGTPGTKPVTLVMPEVSRVAADSTHSSSRREPEDDPAGDGELDNDDDAGLEPKPAPSGLRGWLRRFKRA